MSFPTTPTLDSGAGANQNPLAGNWTSGIFGESNCQRASNQIKGTNAAGYNSCAWNAATYGPDCEFFFTVAATSPTINRAIFAHIKASTIVTHASLNDYFLKIDVYNSAVVFYVETGGVGTALNSVAQAISAGDSFGVQAIGSTLGIWRKPSGGSWALLFTVTDATYASQSGSLIFELPDATTAITNIGGGTVSTVPANTVAPALTGHNNVGLTLAVDNGTWTNSPTSFAYQWQRDNSGGGTYSNIGSATSSMYVVASADLGCNLRCVVTATNAAGSTAANSTATAAVTVASVSFPQTGSAVGQAAIDNTTRANENPLSNGGKWSGVWLSAQAALQLVSNQIVPTTQNKDNQGYWNNATYGPDCEIYADVPALPTDNFQLVARLHNPALTTVTVYMFLRSVSAAVWRYYKRTSSTVVTQIGADDSSYTPVAGDSVGFQVIGSTLKGFHASVRKPWVAHTTGSDATNTTAGNVGIEIDTLADTSGALTNINAGTLSSVPSSVVAPAVTGTPRIENPLSVSNGTWTGSPTFTYQWQRSADGVTGWSNISAATAATYTPVQTADNGQYIRCVVTATNGSGSTSANSNVVGPVPTPLAAKSGQTATVGSLGTWTGAPAPTYSFQWQRNSGSGYTNITGATLQSYLIQAADIGATVRCNVTATNGAGAASALTGPTATVTAGGVSPPNPFAVGQIPIY